MSSFNPEGRSRSTVFDQADVFLEITKEIICQNKVSALFSFEMKRSWKGRDGRQAEEVADKPWEIG